MQKATASNWKQRIVRHTRGGSKHKVESITIYADAFFAQANIHIDAREVTGDRPNGGGSIYMDIEGLSISDLKLMIRQAQSAIAEMEQNYKPC